MSAIDFDRSLSLVLIHEGGNDDDPQDHGGRTSRGITQKEYDAYRSSKTLASQDVWAATDAEVKEIYHDQYWEPYCDKLPAGLDYEFFDFCVNAGRQQAVKTLQRSLKNVPVDGMYGLRTQQAIDGINDLGGLIHSYADLRRSFYQANAQFSRYGKGWIRRTNEVESVAEGMVSNKPFAPPTVSDDGATAKANPENISLPFMSAQTSATGTAISGVLGGASDQLQQISTAIQPVADSFMWAKYACIGISVVCACLAIYAVIHTNKTAATI